MENELKTWREWIATRLTAAGIELTPLQQLAIVLALTLDGAKLPEVAPRWVTTRRG